MNVLFIAVDDLNDWVGCLEGHPQAHTPHLDRLAARGTLFTNAHCQAPVCNPSRTSVMTGLRPTTTGVYALQPWLRDVEELAELVTLPQHFAASGYATLGTGKLFHGGYGRGVTDSELAVLGPPATVGAKPATKLVETPNPHPLVDWGTFPHEDEERGDFAVASWAVERLTGELAESDEPFFLGVGFFLPHVPCYAPPEWFEVSPEDEVALPEVPLDDRDDTPRSSWYLHWDLPEPRLAFLQEAGEWRSLVRAYLASIAYVDAQLGRVLAALEEGGHADDTLVVLWSDHGFHLGEKLVTGKNTLWEPSTRVPLVFAGPGVAEGARCDSPVELLDLYPTLVELCGLPGATRARGSQPRPAAPGRGRAAPVARDHLPRARQPLGADGRAAVHPLRGRGARSSTTWRATPTSSSTSRARKRGGSGSPSSGGGCRSRRSDRSRGAAAG